MTKSSLTLVNSELWIAWPLHFVQLKVVQNVYNWFGDWASTCQIVVFVSCSKQQFSKHFAAQSRVGEVSFEMQIKPREIFHWSKELPAAGKIIFRSFGRFQWSFYSHQASTLLIGCCMMSNELLKHISYLKQQMHLLVWSNMVCHPYLSVLEFSISTFSRLEAGSTTDAATPGHTVLLSNHL